MKTIEHAIGELFIKTNLQKRNIDIETVQMLLGVERDHAISLMAILTYEQLKQATA